MDKIRKNNKKSIIYAFFKIIKLTFNADRVSFISLLVCLIIVSLIPFAISFLDSKVIDEIVYLLELDQSSRVFAQLIIFVAGVILLTVIDKITWAFFAFAEKSHYFSVRKYIEGTFLKKISELDMYHFEDNQTNNLIQKVKDMYDYKPSNVANRFIWMIGDLIRVVTSILIVLTFSMPAFILVLITTIPGLIANMKLGSDSWDIWDGNSLDRRKYWWAKEVLSKEDSIMELRIFRTSDYLMNLVKNIYSRFTEKERKNQVKRAFLESIFGNLSTLGSLGFWIIAITSTLNGQITLGLLTFYVASTNSFSTALASFFRYLSAQYEDSLYLVDFFKFLNLENIIKEGKVAIEDTKKVPVIEFRNVSFKYTNSERYVLQDFNLTINPGERIALVGVNGAGKTTLIKLLCRFYDVTEGTILIDGIDIRDLTFESLYTKMGVLFQDFIRYSQFDVKTNIELGDLNNIGNTDKVNEAVFKADAQTFIDLYEKKLEQILDKSIEGGVNPSGGQWQRIALARAFFRNAPILILDEPTSAIDAKAEFEIFERLYEFSIGKSVIIVSHRFSTVRKADKIYVLDKGTIVEQGSHAELLALNGKYAEAFKTQAKGYM